MKSILFRADGATLFFELKCVNLLRRASRKGLMNARKLMINLPFILIPAALVWAGFYFSADSAKRGIASEQNQEVEAKKSHCQRLKEDPNLGKFHGGVDCPPDE